MAALLPALGLVLANEEAILRICHVAVIQDLVAGCEPGTELQDLLWPLLGVDVQMIERILTDDGKNCV